jgi:Holliday junction resolvase RusA-like endonuclease
MGGGKFAARVYDAGTAEGWKSSVAVAAQPHIPQQPLHQPLWVSLAFRLSRPKSHFTKRGALTSSAPSHPTNKKDCDNLAKAVLDALTQVGVWQDDGQVVTLVISKIYSAVPGVGVFIQPQHTQQP